MTFWKTDAFKAVQKAWYDRLEAEGFEDAEEMVGEEMLLKQTAEHAYEGQNALQIDNKETYFLVLAQKIHEAEFKRDIDRTIMVLRADGVRITHISQELARIGMPRRRHTIMFTIRKYEMMWGIRTYTPKQLAMPERAWQRKIKDRAS